MSDLRGRTVLLTGALGSLGRAQARLLCEEGARVIALDRPDRDDGDEVAAGFAEGTPGETRYVGHDLADLEATEALGRRLGDEGDGVAVLINNAALIINRPFEEFSLAEYEDQVRVNSSAAFALARGVAPAMKRARLGRIVNFCSITLNGRWDGYVPYVASKGAMLGLTKSLARELGPHGVRVNAVSPGAVVSEAEARVFGDRAEEYAAWVVENQCLKSRIEPEHVARLVRFLVSSDSDMITGQNVAVDGGW